MSLSASPEPHVTPWVKLTHEVRADVSGPVTAQTIATFATLVPDHAEISMASYHPQKQVSTLVAHWPHELDDNAVHDRTCLQHPHRFDIGQDIASNGALYGIDAADASQPLEGCESLWNDRPCIRTKGHHDGPAYTPHVYQAAAAGGDLYSSRTVNQ